MSPARWHRLKSIYESVLERDPLDWANFIDECCRDDPDIGEQLGRMLADRDPASHFFDHPIVSFGATDLGLLRDGDILCNRYHVVELLGSGGMGQVYAVTDALTGQRIALKTLQLMSPTALSLFKNEFRSLAGLSHPNLVTLFELYLLENHPFFTMELVQGRDLVDYFNALPTLGEPQIYWPILRQTLYQVVEGVDALHRAGKIHCDLKPSNILVENGGRVRVLDFGLVRSIRPSKWEADTTIPVGTLSYMSPEQTVGQPLMPATDWYSLGVLMYEVLTGELPFRGSQPELLEQKLRGRPAISEEVATRVPTDLAGISLDLLDPWPERRPNASELRERLAAGQPYTVAGEDAPLPADVFVGREHELTLLNAAYGQLCDGEQVTVFVEGSSGIGKTALVERFLKDLQEREAVAIFAGRCYEQENVPYKALDAVVDAICRHLTDLPDGELQKLVPGSIRYASRIFRALLSLPGRSAPEPDLDDVETRRRGIVAIRELLARLGARQNTVLFIDDLQWGDAESAVLLSELVRGDNAPRFLLIASTRSGHELTSPCLQMFATLAKDSPRLRIRVEALKDDESRELARQLLATAKPQSTKMEETLSRESGGNPYYLHELVRSGLPRGNEAGIDNLVGQAVAAVPEAGRRLVQVVAISGKPMSYDDASATAEVDCRDPRLMIALRSSRLVRTMGSGVLARVDLYHDRVREAVLKTLPREKERELHLKVARVMLRAGDRDLEKIASHFEHGGDGMAAGVVYRNAAEAAEIALAFEHAADLFGKALELGQFHPDESRSLRVRMGTALTNAGRCLQAAETFESALEGASVAESRVLLRKAAYNLCVSGHVERGRAAYAKLLSEIGMRLPQSPTASLARLLWARIRLRLRGLRPREYAGDAAAARLIEMADAAWTAATGLGMIDVFSAAAFSAEGLLLALDSGDRFQIARFLLWEAVIRGMAAEGNRDARRLLNLAKDLVDQLGDAYLDGLLELATGFQLYQACRFREAETHFARAETCFRERCRGANWELTTAQHQRVHSLVVMGEHGQVAELLPHLLHEARDKGDLYSSTTLAVFPEALSWLRLDRPTEALVELHNALAKWPQRGMTFQRTQALMGEGWIRMYMQQPLDVLELLQREWPALRGASVLRRQIHRIAFLDLRCRSSIAAADGHPHAARLLAAAERDAERLNRETIVIGPALAAIAFGCLSLFRGEQAVAVRQLTRAIPIFREVDMGLFVHSAARAVGAIQGGAKGSAAAREAEEWMRVRGFQNPARMAAACVPLPAILTKN